MLGRESSVGSGARQLLHLDVRRWGSRRRTVVGDHPQSGGVADRQHLRLAGGPPVGVEDHPNRAGPGNGPHRELTVVGDDSAHTDHDGINQSPQAMQVGPVGGARYVAGVAGAGRNETVEALSELGEHEAGTGGNERAVALDELLVRADRWHPAGDQRRPSVVGGEFRAQGVPPLAVHELDRLRSTPGTH